MSGPACAATCKCTFRRSSKSAQNGWACRCLRRPSIPPLPRRLAFRHLRYICGLNFMVSGVRELLDGYGWHKKQIVFERYD